jgi:hypothetical protein
MNTSALPEEIVAKARKEQEYQAQLREQIEEKKRKKDEEERKAEETKKKELEEYLRVHYKGKIPEYVLQKLPSKNKSHRDQEGTDDSIYNVGRKANVYDEEDYGGANDMDNSRARGGKKHTSRLGFDRRSSPDEEDELTLDIGDDDDVHARRGPPRRRFVDRDEEGRPREKWVSQSEYDELSKLCDKLLAQQDSLQTELRNQAKLLKVSLETNVL